MVRLRELRQERQISLRDLSRELGIAYPSLGKYITEYIAMHIDYLDKHRDIRDNAKF